MTTLIGLLEVEDEWKKGRSPGQLEVNVDSLEEQWRNKGLIEFPDEDRDNELSPFFHEGFNEFLQEFRDAPEEKEDDRITKENVFYRTREYHRQKMAEGAYQKPGISHYVFHSLERIAAGAMLAVSLPIIGATALAVKASAPGKAFYKQRRVGKFGERITVYKIKSLEDGFDKKWESGEHENKDPYGTVGTNSDALIRLYGLPLGKIMRKIKIDESPQLWNVVKGEMSLFGPRPLAAKTVADILNAANREYGKPDIAHNRSAVNPGLFGPEQIGDAAKLDWRDRIYGENRLPNMYHTMNPLAAHGYYALSTIGFVGRQIGNKLFGRANEYLGNAA